MSKNPKLQDMGEHAQQLLILIEQCKPDADLHLLSGQLKNWRIELSKISNGKKTATGLFIHDNQTVSNLRTGLMWKRECESKEYTYDEATERFKGNDSFAVYNDWRLPTIIELRTLLLKNPPYIDTEAFPNNPSYVWSSSPYINFSSFAWFVNFSDGDSNNLDRNYYFGVRLVRGGQ